MNSPFSRDRSPSINVLLVEAGYPLVRFGGGALRELREDFFDAAWNVNVAAGVSDIPGIYHTAMMGGEPYAIWH